MRRERVQLVEARVFEGVVILRAAHQGIYGQVLNGLHVEPDPLNSGNVLLEPVDDFRDPRGALA